MPNDRGARRLIALVASVGTGLLGFYGFLAYRSYLWSPMWVIHPTTAALPDPPTAAYTPSQARGLREYEEMRCVVCHGPEGRGGVSNPNADPGGKIPGLRGVASAYTPDDLKYRIRNGSHPVPLDDKKPDPPIAMPGWEKVLSDRQLDDVISYLGTLKKEAAAPRS